MYHKHIINSLPLLAAVLGRKYGGQGASEGAPPAPVDAPCNSRMSAGGLKQSILTPPKKR